MAAQDAAGRTFTRQQHWWLDRMAQAIGVNSGVRVEDFQYGELLRRGGWYPARELFGQELPELLRELNATLVV